MFFPSNFQWISTFDPSLTIINSHPLRMTWMHVTSVAQKTNMSRAILNATVWMHQQAQDRVVFAFCQM